jgi:methanogenic corrinoid protein MtbC1
MDEYVLTSHPILEKITGSLIGLDIDNTKRACMQALEAQVNPFTILEGALAPAMNEVGRKFEAGEFFLAELIMAGEIMKECMGLLGPRMATDRSDAKGTVVIGTVSGDLHSIGKDIVVTLLRANGFTVSDMGTDVPNTRFVEEVIAKKPDILALSALLTTSMPEMEKVIRALEKAGVRSGLKIIVGGSPVSAEFAKEVGADAASRDAVEGVNICLEWIREKQR